MNQDYQSAVDRINGQIRDLLAFVAFSFAAVQFASAEETPDYLKAVSGRADRIVAKLAIEARESRERVHELIMNQYRWLNEVHSNRDAEIESIKSEAIEPKLVEQKVLRVRESADEIVKERHSEYLQLLSEELTPTQVERVKDEMTYGVVPITYNGYIKMLPELTDEQKQYILEQLEEAREIAMDAGTSDEKHKWFGKYKGRINNYLSKAGYDLKAASKRAEAD